MQTSLTHTSGWPGSRFLAIHLSEAEARELAGMNLRGVTPALTLTAYGIVGACREAVAIWDRAPSPSGHDSPMRRAATRRGWLARLLDAARH